MITVTFSPESERQVAALAQAMTAYLGATPPPAEDAPPAVDEAPKATRKVKKAETPATEIVVEIPAITLEQVRAKLTELSQGGKAADVKTLIAKFGAAKLTDIKPGNYAAILADAEAL